MTSAMFPGVLTPLAGAIAQAVRLRGYQTDLEADIYAAWNTAARNVLAVLPTGGGKTVLFAKILAETNGASVAIAHRQELVSQISLALARYGVRHTLFAPKKVIKEIVSIHLQEVGVSFFDSRARCAVAGVDTLIRMDKTLPWFAQVVRWVQDEAHHVLAANKWGRAAGMFPNAIGLGVTATPNRADGKGLGRHAEGLFDVMVCGPSMRWLINSGYLTDYKIAVAPETVDITGVEIGASGEFSQAQIAKAHREAKQLVGDVVGHYLKFARGKLGITFAQDIEEATKLAAAYRDAGVPAEVVSSKTPDALRMSIMRRFRKRELLQLVNVDLFGEGVDIPCLEVISMARHTASLPLFIQMCGRVLRLQLDAGYLKNWDDYTVEQRLAIVAASTKPFGLIIDHVGNVERHLLPDRDRTPGTPGGWSLDSREKRGRTSADDAIPLTHCTECYQPYERVHAACPYCGHMPDPPAGRRPPKLVDGDLLLIDFETLREMRGEIQRIADAPRFPTGASPAIAGSIKRNHFERQQAQARLRHTLSWYGGLQLSLGRPDSEGHRRFFFAYGLDVMTAQTLGTKEADELAQRVTDDLAKAGVTVPSMTPEVPV